MVFLFISYIDFFQLRNLPGLSMIKCSTYMIVMVGGYHGHLKPFKFYFIFIMATQWFQQIKCFYSNQHRMMASTLFESILVFQQQ